MPSPPAHLPASVPMTDSHCRPEKGLYTRFPYGTRKQPPYQQLRYYLGYFALLNWPESARNDRGDVVELRLEQLARERRITVANLVALAEHALHRLTEALERG